MPKARTITVRPEDKFLRWQTTDKQTAKIFQGDVLEVLRTLPSKSVQMVVTSPPYWGLRDYKTSEWAGGASECDHIKEQKEHTLNSSSRLGFPANGDPRRIGENNNYHEAYTRQYDDVCGKCGAERVDRQLGSEKVCDCLGWARGENCALADWSSACYVCRMTLVFREMRRVLRDDGVFYLNLGDTYGEGGRLILVPARMALSLQADDWVLRSDIPWVKRNAMPESCTNRPAKALEYVFLFSKKTVGGYFYDQVAVKTKSVSEYASSSFIPKSAKDLSDTSSVGTAATRASSANRSDALITQDRNWRNTDLWFESVEVPYGVVGVGDEVVGIDCPTQPSVSSHFAVFGERLITPMILSGSSESGCCSGCGAPYRRVTEERKLTRDRPNEFTKRTGEEGTGNSCANTVAGVEVKTLRWEPTCWCHEPVKSLVHIEPPGVSPCVVLDPFLGSATSIIAALKHGRRGWGIELSEQYVEENAIPRVSARLLDLGLGHLVPRVHIATPVVGDVIEVL